MITMYERDLGLYDGVEGLKFWGVGGIVLYEEWYREISKLCITSLAYHLLSTPWRLSLTLEGIQCSDNWDPICSMSASYLTKYILGKELTLLQVREDPVCIEEIERCKRISQFFTAPGSYGWMENIELPTSLRIWLEQKAQEQYEVFYGY